MLIGFHEIKGEHLERHINNKFLVNNAQIFVLATPEYIIWKYFLHYLLHIH